MHPTFMFKMLINILPNNAINPKFAPFVDGKVRLIVFLYASEAHAIAVGFVH